MLVVLFFALVIEKPLMNALIMTGISEGFSAVLVGVVGFVILWLMERVWKRYGPIKTNKSWVSELNSF